MADYKYAYNGPEEGTVKALLKGAAISTKTAIEMSKHLKGKKTHAAKAFLERVISHENALPYTRFVNGLGHKKGPMGAGRYPEKAAKAFLQLISNAEANASQAGLSSELKILHLLAQEASRPYHYGRLRRRQVKSTHVEIVVKELEPKKKTTKQAVPKAVETITSPPESKQPEIETPPPTVKKGPTKPAVKKDDTKAGAKPASQPKKETAQQ